MAAAPLLLTPSEHHWVCARCDEVRITREHRPHTPFHPCRGLKGLTTPFLPEGTKAKVTPREREDYIGREIVTLDGDQRPIMSVVTEREDGEDCTVYAPCAVGSVR